MASDRDSNQCLQSAPDRNDRPHRAKTVSSVMARMARVAPVRQEGRAIASRMLARHCDEADVEYAQAATTLGISDVVFGAFAEPSKPQQITVGDVIALHLGGRQGLALAYLTDIVRMLESRAKKLGLTPLVHLQRFAASLGNIASVADGPDREQYVAELRQLLRKVEQALLDAESGGR